MRKTEKKNPTIIDQTNAVSVTKENGTDVSFFYLILLKFIQMSSQLAVSKIGMFTTKSKKLLW